MYVARHDTPGIQLKPLIFNTIPQAVDDDITINPPDKNVYPIYSRKTYKMKLLVIVKFIFSAHVAKIDKVVWFRKQHACDILGLSYAALNLDQGGD